ncbi:hypothetical protein IWQ62_003764 [Dispira parvispora]|uniref:Uncharacterized protein n=1 Tax=Dispira parvispora TaxID=1520584 RepID=A0A9W8AU82_9FUNG|nr:hypothetical protein IWQ62_003764 [Dispira parvispora]
MASDQNLKPVTSSDNAPSTSSNLVDLTQPTRTERYTTQTHYLQLTQTLALKLTVYLQTQHASWFGDVQLQQVLAFLKPQLVRQLDAFAPTSRRSSTALDYYRCKEFQLAYGLTASTESHGFCLMQHPPIKTEDNNIQEITATNNKDARGRSAAGTCRYTGLRVHAARLVVFAEPYDPHNPVSVPDILGLTGKEASNLDQYLWRSAA